MTPQERLIATARGEIGYLEKKTNAELEDKTANAGSGNFTKYARDLDAMRFYNGKKNGYDWCAVFAAWCFVKTFGLGTALKMTGQPLGGLGAGVRYAAQYYKNIGRFCQAPQPGDQIFFGTGTVWSHTGLVTSVSGNTVITVEGNTTSTPGMVANGGCVREKIYSRAYARILGYGRPDWSLVEKSTETTKETTQDTTKEEEPEMTQETFNQMFERAMKAYGDRLAVGTVAEWAKTGWEAAEKHGVLDGSRPCAPVTRQELAVVLARTGALESGGKI